MNVQATVRATGNDERAILARAAISLVQLINARANKFFTLFMTALYESRRREAEKVIRRYGHLIHNPKD